MALPAWIGGATAVVEVDTFTPANVEIGDIFTLTAVDEAGTTLVAISFTATIATVANAAAGLVAAWNANTTAAAIATATGTVTVILTALTANIGIPFHVAGTTTDGGGTNTQTLTRVATVPNAGPNAWGTAANFSTGSVPVSTDTVTIDARGASYPIYYDLNQSSVTLAALKHYVGAPAVGTTSVALKISATLADVHMPATGTVGSSNLFNINVGTIQTNCVDWGGNDAGGSGLPGTMFAGTHASNVFTKLGGAVTGIGLFTPGQASTIATLNAVGGTLIVGSGVTLTTIVNKGCTLTINSAATTLTNTQGSTTINGTGTVTTANANGGTIIANNRTTAFTTLNMNGATVDFSQNAAAFTVTTTTWKDGGGTIKMLTSSQGTLSTIAYAFATKTAMSLQAA